MKMVLASRQGDGEDGKQVDVDVYANADDTINLSVHSLLLLFNTYPAPPPPFRPLFFENVKQNEKRKKRLACSAE